MEGTSSDGLPNSRHFKKQQRRHGLGLRSTHAVPQTMHQISRTGRADVVGNFFERLTRRHVMPLYRFSHLSESPDINGSISDGDNDIWMGQRDSISNGAWRLIDASPNCRKRSRSPSVSLDEPKVRRVYKFIIINTHPSYCYSQGRA